MSYSKFLLILIFTLWIIFAISVIESNSKEVKKPVSQSTSQENKIRKQMFNSCVKQTGSRSKCYYLYY